MTCRIICAAAIFDSPSLGVSCSDVNKDWTHKNQDKDKDQSYKNKD